MIESLFWNENVCIERLAAVLRDGGVAIGSSDTVFGLIANLKSQGKKSLDLIKKRVDKPYLILLPDTASLSDYVDPSTLLQIEKIAKRCWPGPVTLICKAHPSLPDFMKGPEGTVALRKPAHAGLQTLLTHLDGVFSTSANISGQPVPKSIDEVDPAILAHCAALILDSRNKKEASQIPSTILDCTGDKIKVIREGAVPSSELLSS